jgi:hypothetical protein
MARWMARIVAGWIMVLGAIPAAQAQERMPPEDIGVAQAARPDYRTLPRTAQWSTPGGTYALLSGVRALAHTGLSQEEARAAGLDVVELRGPFTVYRESGAAVRTRAVREEATVAGRLVISHAAVVNLRTGGIGILTGQVIVKPQRMDDADAIAASSGLVIKTRATALGWFLAEPLPGMDPIAVAAGLRGDVRVQSAAPEVLEHFRVPR